MYLVFLYINTGKFVIVLNLTVSDDAIENGACLYEKSLIALAIKTLPTNPQQKTPLLCIYVYVYRKVTLI